MRHYYVADDTVVQPKGGAWIIEHLERCRARLRDERDPVAARTLKRLRGRGDGKHLTITQNAHNTCVIEPAYVRQPQEIAR
jgi:hypothetical protein